MQETLFLIDEQTGRPLQFGDLKRHLLFHQALNQAELAVFSSLLKTLFLSSSQKLAKDAIDRSIAEDIKFFAKVLFFSCLALGLDSDVITINT